MKILVLSSYYKPDLGANSFRCSALVEELRKRLGDDAQIDVITTQPNRYASFNVDAPICEQQEGLTIYRVPLPAHNSGMLDQSIAFIYYAKEVRKLVKSESYSLIVATSGRLMTAVLASWVSKKKDAKVYLDVRDIFVDTIGDVLPRKLSMFIKPIFSKLERWAFNRANHINLVSLGFMPYFLARYPNQNFSTFTNGIDDLFIMPNDIEPKNNISSKPIIVLYAGNIGEGQGLHAIIPVLAKRLQGQVHFKIFGDGGGRQKLEMALNEINCTNVEVNAPIERAQLINEYNKADILFLHLNNHEAFKKVLPSKLFEYAAMGKPIWAGISGYSAEFVGSEIPNSAIFKPCDSLDAERAFKSLSLVTQRRDNFIKKYSRQKIMQDMVTDILSLTTK